MTSARKVLVVGPSWVGDMVMAQALYRLLRAREPEIAIHVIGPAWSLPVIERMPEVERGIELAVGHGELGLARRLALGRALRTERYAQAIVLPRSLKAALVPFFARVPQRTGFRGEWRYGLINDTRPYDKSRLDRTVRRFAALGIPAGAEPPRDPPQPRLAVDHSSMPALAARLGLALDRPVVALMPGAEYGPAKRWPTEYFAALAARLDRAGCSIWVLGSAKEAALGEAILDAGGGINLCGRTTLGEAIDLLGTAAVAVSNDSGLMHVAAAVGTHVVALYGSSSPDFTPPLTAARTIFHLGLECSPCFERRCPLGHTRCLYDISVDAVLASVVDRIAAPGEPAARTLGTTASQGVVTGHGASDGAEPPGAAGNGAPR